MPDPIRLEGASARFLLPLLFSGQSQKEVFVNQSIVTLDGVIHCAVDGIAAAPPAEPADGAAWLVAVTASGEWAGYEGQLALRQAGQWLFVPLRDGMQVLDRSRQQIMHRIGGAWRAPVRPAAPGGGSVVDAEARQAIASLVAALQQWGVFAA